MASSGCEARVFSKVLIANRGEIAVRVIRTLRRLSIASVAVYSDADAGAPHVRAADEAVRIGPPPAAQSYLSIEAIIAAARATGAQAIHPGYGFLAENARFARACAAAGLTFIGPPPEAIEAMGDKIAAKATVSAAGVPVVPGAGARGWTDQQLLSQLNETWFPVLVKPSAGGGGKGMRVARVPAELPEALASARREARAAFGDDTLLVEKYIDRPRHIEIQVLADSHGTVIHLGERECSLQRRHQKVIEEAPSPLLDEARRAAMGAAAVEAARSVGYVGAGTVECIVDGWSSALPGGDGSPSTPRGEQGFSFYFMEMNTRLQVEHPVTELVTGLDLVEWQIRVAAGEPLGAAALTARLTGHAVEARVYAEDPARGFLPTGGTVLGYREPEPDPGLRGPGGATVVRVDSGVTGGSVVTSAYDPMLAKVAAWGPDRPTALRRLDAALRATTILGVTTNVGFLRGLLADPDVQAGHLDTGLIERLVDANSARSRVASGAITPLATRDHEIGTPGAVLAAAALMLLSGNEATVAGGVAAADVIASARDAGVGDGRGNPRVRAGWGNGTVGAGLWNAGAGSDPGSARGVTDPWDIADGWRVGEHAWTRLRLSGGAGDTTSVRVRLSAGPGAADGPARGLAPAGAQVAIGAGEPVAVRVERNGDQLLVGLDEATLTFRYALDGRTVWLGRDGQAWAITEVPAAGRRGGAAGAADNSAGTVRSPMPGTVLSVRVSAGDTVTAGQPLAVIEAMKMEHTVTAPLAGIVAELPVKAGQQVRMDETVAVITPGDERSIPGDTTTGITRGDGRSIPPNPPTGIESQEGAAGA
jgi:acetyl-CoA/propionyl-CoA carboxylase biotin carboxyl carrier protein